MSDFAFDEEEEPTSPFWMATFSDMMTLLLTFFVMLVAMSEIEVKKFEEALSYFTGRQGVLADQGLLPGVQAQPRDRAEEYESIVRDLHEAGLAGLAEVDLTERGIRVTLVDSVAFESGSAALVGPAESVLARVARATAGAGTVEVEGHTDDRPIATAAYPSNWELSAARAVAVVRFLVGQPGALDPGRYLAAGYGEHRPRAPNGTAEGRARNRRITVLFRTAEPRPDSPLTTPDFPPHVRR